MPTHPLPADMHSSCGSPYADNSLFRAIPRELLRSPRLRVEEVRYDAGVMVFDEGDRPDYCYLVGSGEVRISKAGAGGEEELLAVVEAGDFFGELAVFDGAPRSARATTVAPTRLGRLSRDAFDFLRRSAPSQLAATLAERAIERVRHTNDLLAARGAPLTGGAPAGECARCGALWSDAAAPCSGCGGSLRPAAVPAVLAGKFRMTRRLGSGGMGVVYHAVDGALDREVAIKTLPALGAREADALRREARTMAAVQHPHLALIYGVESWRGAPMLVVEHLPRGTLAELLACGPLPLDAVLETGAALARALDRLHESGLLHGDIKPSNIGFAADGTAKLLDFGLAHMLGAAQGGPLGRATGAVAGTLPYLSPEAARGEAPDAGWDLWSLCITAYEAVAGAHPFARGNPHALLLRIAEANIPDVRGFNPDLPAPVAGFFRDALAPDRARRPASARELAARLAGLRT